MIANLIAAIGIFGTFLAESRIASKAKQPDSGGSESPANNSPRTLGESNSENKEIEVVRERIRKQLYDCYKTKFLADFEHPDSIAKENFLSMKEAAYRRYSRLLADLHLGPDRLDFLVTLLSRRGVQGKYFTNAPQELVALGIPASLTIGSEVVDEQISLEFGHNTLDVIKAFDSHESNANEETDVFKVLSSVGITPNDQQEMELSKILRMAPLPENPKNMKDPEVAGHYRQERQARVETILGKINDIFGDDAQKLLQRYLLAKEQVAIDLDDLQLGKGSK